MSTDLEVRNTNLQVGIPDDIVQKLVEHSAKVNVNPPKNDVFARNDISTKKGSYLYIPISFLEMKLDEMFLGMWSTENFQYQAIANELIGSIDVKFYHPIAGTWITRTGAGGVIIRQKKDASITDLSAKIKNALVMDMPHLKAECFRNACVSIGKVFGRDLNREFSDYFDEYGHLDETSKAVAIEELNGELPLTDKEISAIRKLYKDKKLDKNMFSYCIESVLVKNGDKRKNIASWLEQTEIKEIIQALKHKHYQDLIIQIQGIE